MGIESPVLYNYYFKGLRNYVHGTTMFESFCRVLRDNNIDIFEIKDLKFHKELHHNGQIILKRQLTEDEDAPQGLLVASMSFLVDGEIAYINLLDDPDSEVIDRRDDLTGTFIKEVHQTGIYESQGRIVNVKDFESFVTALIEVNKRTHIQTLDDTNKAYSYRWVFLRTLCVDFSLEFPKEVVVKIKHLGLKKGKDGKNYTLNTLNFFLQEKAYKLMISFAYSKR